MVRELAGPRELRCEQRRDAAAEPRDAVGVRILRRLRTELLTQLALLLLPSLARELERGQHTHQVRRHHEPVREQEEPLHRDEALVVLLLASTGPVREVAPATHVLEALLRLRRDGGVLEPERLPGRIALGDAQADLEVLQDRRAPPVEEAPQRDAVIPRVWVDLEDLETPTTVAPARLVRTSEPTGDTIVAELNALDCHVHVSYPLLAVETRDASFCSSLVLTKNHSPERRSKSIQPAQDLSGVYVQNQVV